MGRTDYYGTGTTNNIIWKVWVNDPSSTMTGETVTSGYCAWEGWCGDSGNTSTNDSSTRIWTSWCGDTYHIYRARRPRTEEDRRAVYMAEHQKRKVDDEARLAENKATALFVKLVGRDAYRRFKKNGYHEVVGHSGKRYRLRLGRTIEEMSENFGEKVAANLCIHSSYSYRLPQMDVLIQQLLLILSGEEGEQVLKRTANRTARAA